MENNKSEIVLYKSEDGTVKIDVLMQDENVWLTQDQMASLFDRDKSVISRHISRIFKDRELDSNSVVAKNATTASDGKVYNVDYYNLDVIISVGYRVKSVQGTQFRIWATQRLKEYIIKGFTLNDDRFKNGSSMNYFRELLDRIREIRISEKVFYQQIKDIYATSIDYDSNAKETRAFFQQIQNKFLWAVSQKTAAEIIYYRSNAKLPMMGMTATGVDKIKKSDTIVAKNYLHEDELSALKLLVEQYLAFAESQALAHKPMYMRDWIKKLHDILTINDKAVLMDAGRISHELAVKKAEVEYTQYKEQQKLIEKEDSIKTLIDDAKKLETDLKKRKDKGRKK